VAAVFELKGRGKVKGVGAGRTARGSPPFIRVGGRWPGAIVGLNVINVVDGRRVYGGC
jgi:hypothetical protein